MGDLQSLAKEAEAWNRRANHSGVKINWMFDREKARENSGTHTELHGQRPRGRAEQEVEYSPEI